MNDKGPGAESVSPAHPESAPPLSTHEFRWQALFQESADPIFVLNRRRRILFVNRAWEKLTGLSAAEVRGLVCLRRTPSGQDPLDVIVRAVCCPPPEVLKGNPGHACRLMPGAGPARWWNLDFLPLRDEGGILCAIGKITAVAPGEPAGTSSLSEKLVALGEARRRRYTLDQLSSNMPSCQRVIDQVRVAAQSSAPALIVGEPGTGKQWVAHTIGALAVPASATFAAIDCTRLPAAALSFLLFGRGGLFWQKGNATLYLKEPQCLPRDLQLRLHNDLQEQQGTGGPRLLAGCSTDPLLEVQSGRLLESFYCALSTLVITLLPLRERLLDLPLLVERLLVRIQGSGDRRVKGLTAEALEVVRAYNWPSNLRELHAVMQSACQRTTHERIDVDHLPARLRQSVRLDQTSGPAADKPLNLDQILEQAERRLIALALRKSQGQRAKAAEMLSIWRQRLVRRMEFFGMND